MCYWLVQSTIIFVKKKDVVFVGAAHRNINQYFRYACPVAFRGRTSKL